MDTINQMITQHHNPNLVDKDIAPNGNIQILLFNDGEIMSTKGGSAFLQRSLFSVKPSIDTNITMPQKHGDYSFAIIPNEEIANMIRTKMIEYKSSL